MQSFTNSILAHVRPKHRVLRLAVIVAPSDDVAILVNCLRAGAQAINENGDVVGWAYDHSQSQHAALWTHVR